MAKDKSDHKLSILGADEDLPRLLMCSGYACGGGFAFVHRVRTNEAMLAHQVKGEAAQIWQTSEGQAPSRPPTGVTTEAAALVRFRELKKDAGAAGPATLKGSWTGVLHCGDDGKPQVRLERKVAAYGVLRLVSNPTGSWTASFERQKRWYSTEGTQSVTRTGLADAIQAGMGLVVGMVSEACSFRDTKRRGAVDAEYAATKPPKPKKAPPKDRTEKVLTRMETPAKAAAKPKKDKPPKAPPAPKKAPCPDGCDDRKAAAKPKASPKPKAPAAPKAPRKPRAPRAGNVASTDDKQMRLGEMVKGAIADVVREARGA